MREVGLAATEIGPEGFLPTAPAEMAKVLADHDLSAVGGFAPVLLHDDDHDPVPGISPILDGFVASGAEVLVLAAATGSDGYDSRPELDEQSWKACYTISIASPTPRPSAESGQLSTLTSER